MRSVGVANDKRAISAVQQWRFTPAKKDGQPVAVAINVEIAFGPVNTGAETIEHLCQKANGGDPKAQFELSQFLLASKEQADVTQGFEYLEKAAKQGLPKAQFAMGNFFSSQRQDPVTAYVWYSIANQKHYKHSAKRMKELAQQMTSEQLAEAKRRLQQQ